MNNQLIIRLYSPQGRHRITVNGRDTFGELQIQITKKLGYSLKDLIILTEDNKPLSAHDGKKLYQIPYFKDGVILNISSKKPKIKQQHGVAVQEVKKQIASSKCNHPPGGKCLNCLSLQPKKSGDKQEEKPSAPKCNHGPGGRCLNCTTIDLKDKGSKAKMMCQHGPNAKCVHCLDAEFISDTAHISFDAYLHQKKLKCKGVHPQQVKCNNCLPPSQVRYQVDRTCKFHEPYPKAMCNKCIPPSVVVKRQEYRHVDYVQFMNVTQLGNFVKHWVQKKHMAEQRVGYLYGYYAEDPHYKGGIRVIVEAIYEPQQKGTYNSFEIINNTGTSHADIIANSLSLERVGWIYTETNHDTVMNEKNVRMAARFQQQYRVPHSSGYQISNFITVVLRSDEKNHGEVKPEVYMISDQGQALEKAGLFEDSEARKLMKIKAPRDNKEALPSFICGGKSVTQFEPQFLLVKIAHGSSNSNKFSILKKSEFPVLTRDKPSKNDFKQYLKKSLHKASHIKYGDFNFLLYLAEILDVQTAVSIAEEVQRQGKVPDTIDQLIQHKADL